MIVIFLVPISDSNFKFSYEEWVKQKENETERKRRDSFNSVSGRRDSNTSMSSRRDSFMSIESRRRSTISIAEIKPPLRRSMSHEGKNYNDWYKNSLSKTFIA